MTSCEPSNFFKTAGDEVRESIEVRVVVFNYPEGEESS
jgi:hypothetical protein